MERRLAVRGRAHRLAPGAHLRRVHQAGVIVLVAGEWQAVLFEDRCADAAQPDLVLLVVDGEAAGPHLLQRGS